MKFEDLEYEEGLFDVIQWSHSDTIGVKGDVQREIAVYPSAGIPNEKELDYYFLNISYTIRIANEKNERVLLYTTRKTFRISPRKKAPTLKQFRFLTEILRKETNEEYNFRIAGTNLEAHPNLPFEYDGLDDVFQRWIDNHGNIWDEFDISTQ